MAALHPTLFHMADARNWSSIQQHGLLSTSALLDLLKIKGDERQTIESTHRPQTIEVSGERTVFVRDQRPLSMSALASCLDDVEPDEWLGS